MSWLTDLISSAYSGVSGALPTEVTDVYTGTLPSVGGGGVSFTPFTVTTSGLGNVNTTASGSTQFNLSDSQKILQDSLFGGASTAFTNAMGPRDVREEDMYARIRALQTPEEQRQAMSLEERLFNQGRMGVSTNMYGGTPEQLAMNKAREEAKNTAALQAIQMAQQEQQQQASLGSQFMQQGYAPQANLLNALSAGMGPAGLVDVANRQSAENALKASIANAQTAIGQQQGLANLYGGLFSGALGGVSGLLGGAANLGGQVVGDAAGSFFDWLFND